MISLTRQYFNSNKSKINSSNKNKIEYTNKSNINECN